jgi:hypothetical protein
MSTRLSRIAIIVGLACFVAVSVAAVKGGAETAAPSSATTSAATWPSSIAAIGHSDTNGSGVKGPRTNWPHSSWVTGDSHDVQSLYSRILARNPAIRGNKFNLAINGADAASMLLQARKAVGLKPTPELVVVHGIDNDIGCDPVSHKPFQAAFARVLEVLATGLPEARIFVVSQFGSPTTHAKALTIKQRLRLAGAYAGGSSPCDFIGRDGAIRAKQLAYLEAVIHRYETAVATACEPVSTCRYDGGAFGRVVDRRDWISTDLHHFSLEGNAKAAAVAWAALKRVGFIPSTG